VALALACVGILLGPSLAFAANKADLSLTKTVDELRPFVGEEITFTVTVRNDGPADATWVEVTDRLDPGFSYLRDSSAGEYDPETGVWRIGKLRCYESVSLDITVVVGAEGPYVNAAEVTRSDQKDPDSRPGDGKGDDYDSVEVRPRKLADLSVQKTVDDFTPPVGADVTFTVSVTNDGPNRATWVDVTDRLQPGFTYVSDDSDGTYDADTGLWKIGRLNAGHTVRLNLTATVNGEGSYVNAAEVTFSDQKDPDSTPGDGRGDDFASIELFPEPDGDGDGVPPSIDLDDDNDGITDIEEGDGSRDSDGDGHPDSRDIDADNDGIVDNEEAQPENGYIPPSGQDADNDGLDDAYDGAPADPDALASTGLTPVNTDGTDLPDYLDLDTDDDTVPDRTEGHDANMDGQPDNPLLGRDADGDGLDDGYDVRPGDATPTPDASNAPRQDTDGDGIRDWRDPDDDDDGLPTEDEDPNGNGDPTDDDTDDDGTPNYLDPDRLPGSISGSAWLDADADDVFDTGETPAAGWILELETAGQTVVETLTGERGDYMVTDLAPGSYMVQVRNPENRAVFARLQDIALPEETDLTEQNLPIDPSGVVYGALQRDPIAGARITMTDAAGNGLPAVCFLPDQQDQLTGASGFYRFDVVLGADAACPSGAEYRLAVSAPSGFAEVPSLFIPAQATLDPTGGADPFQVVPQQLAPQEGEPTLYHLSLLLESGDPDVVNNHIPLDPVGVNLGSALGLRLLKRADRSEASIGDLVRYTITVAHTSPIELLDVTLTDDLPPGFNLVAGSARLNGVPIDPLSADGRSLIVPGVTVPAASTVELTYVMRVGAGVTQGDYVNTVRAEQAGVPIGSPATAVVSIVGDPDFEQTTVIGTVWDDQNGDGWQDPGERGIPGVRVATLTGLLIETDQFGRFHVAAVDVEQLARGQNYYLKVDPATLPPGVTFTTENPRVKRITQGLMNRFDFGVRLPPGEASAQRRIEIGSVLFSPGSAQPTEDGRSRLNRLSDRIAEFDCGVLSIDARAGSCPVIALNAEEHTLTSQFEVLSAELTAEYRRELEAVAAPWERRRITRVSVIGHASSELIRPRSRHIFADNYVLSAARARSAALYLSELLGIPVSEMVVEGRGPDEPIASNATEAGRILNRRAEVQILGESFTGCLAEDYDSAELAERRAEVVLDALSPTGDGQAVCAIQLVDAPAPELWPPLGESSESSLSERATPAQVCETCVDGIAFEVSSLGDASGPSDDEPTQRRAVVSADLSMALPSGGSIWVAEDPAVVDPRLAVVGPTRVGLRDGRLADAVEFATYNNYPDFIDRLELRLFRSSDVDRVDPVAVVPVEIAAFSQAMWEGDGEYAAGEELTYTLRAYGAGAVDETAPRYLVLGDREESLENDQPSDADVVTALYAQPGPARQNIALNASRVRIHGRDIDPLAAITINDERVPLDATGRIAIDYLVPPGEHEFRVAVTDGQARMIERQFVVDTTGDSCSWPRWPT